VSDWYDKPETPKRCRMCRATVVSRGVPAGWYSLRTADGGDNPRMGGLICSVACLADAVRDLEARS
jgi:hypothetical protein